MSWQWAAVLLIEAVAVAFLLWKVFGRASDTPRVLQKPDVPTSALLRHQKGEGGGTGRRRGGSGEGSAGAG